MTMASTRKRIDPKTVPEIAHRLRLLRAATGLSQTEFAKSLGVARNVWSNAEGEFGRVGVDTALKACDVYRVTLDWIYRGDRAMMPSGLMERIDRAEREGTDPDA